MQMFPYPGKANSWGTFNIYKDENSTISYQSKDNFHTIFIFLP